jgi:serine/threonine protein kinase/tetratricopeptide (TPR) repeat protein
MRPQNGTPAAPPSEDSVAQALEDYLEAAEAGTAPPREEFLARHPELAEQLDGCLAALRFIGRAARGPLSAAGVGEVQPPAPASGTLGDFRLIREVGRGGMGVVYEAEQVSLGRRVALKVLPFAATMDPRQLQRFHNEARAAASLDHPHIVHVHAVGCERAVHFYAMQFIEGQTLAAVIADLRRAGGKPVPSEEQPTTPHVPEAPAADTAPQAAASTERTRLGRAHYRRVAEWGIQAAEALDHAHALGIVHRDVKPGNLLVDGRGGLWVTDFGLAHIQSDARLTMTGDLVGTLRYMSPEQALAKRVVVDHRTDVYSLGATLYELLTLEPAFTGNDRQELLRQIAFEEPRPPRRVSKAIPVELETIVLKAMEKNPAERYATAKALADDLRRWLADEPIRARRPGLVGRGRKWARRHQAVVWSTTLVALILAASVGWVLGDRSARRREAEGKVVQALDEAGSRLPQGNPWDPALTSAAQRAGMQLDSGLLGRDSRRRVEQLQRDMRMLAELERIRLAGTEARRVGGEVGGQHFDYAACVAQYGDPFRDYGIDVKVLGPEGAAARVRASAIREPLVAGLDHWAYMLWGVGEEEPRQTARQLLAVTRQVDPDVWRNRLRELPDASGTNDLSELIRTAPVEELSAATLDLLCLAVILVPQGGGRVSELVLEVLRRAQRRFPASFYINHGLAFALAHAEPPQREEAIGFYRAAMALRPGSPGAHFNLGNVLREKGRLDEAVAEYREALQLKPDYAEAHTNLAAVLREQGKLAEAEAADRRSIQLQPENAEAHTNLAAALCDQGRLDEAIAECREAMRIKPSFGGAHNVLGNALQARGQPDEAIAEYREAIRLTPDDFRPHFCLGNTLRDKGRLDEAIAEFHESIRLNKDYAGAHNNLGSVLFCKGQRDEALAKYREALALKPDFADAHCNIGLVLEVKGQFAEALTSRRRGHELGSRDPRWRFPSAEWVKQCERLVELDGKLPAILSGTGQPADAAERAEYADVCQKKRLYAAAARLYREAISAKPDLVASPVKGVRYNAACAAALAGCGTGEGAAKLSEAERAGFRKQALDWLRADLDLRRGQLDKEPAQVAEKMQHWLIDPDFNGVRGPDALARLPEAERERWQKLWADVAATLARAQQKGTPAEKKASPGEATKKD